jgi:hypothetical protein
MSQMGFCSFQESLARERIMDPIIPRDETGGSLPTHS